MSQVLIPNTVVITASKHLLPEDEFQFRDHFPSGFSIMPAAYQIQKNHLIGGFFVSGSEILSQHIPYTKIASYLA
jgi:3-hydroxymyristoyl/3-hydroxydecanoyl-(acyl carrier protein) dehydratase